MSGLLRVVDGFGAISILRLSDMQNRPKLFSSFMLQMLTELYATLPEVGDLEKPKLVIFIDEAPLHFRRRGKVAPGRNRNRHQAHPSQRRRHFFLHAIADRRSPEAVLSQLGMKVEHALRAFTAKERNSIKRCARLSGDAVLQHRATPHPTGDWRSARHRPR